MAARAAPATDSQRARRMIDPAVARRLVELRKFDADVVVVAEADDGSAILVKRMPCKAESARNTAWQFGGTAAAN